MVEHWPSKRKTLSSNSSTGKKKRYHPPGANSKNFGLTLLVL
jgi:hypothetical protein